MEFSCQLLNEPSEDGASDNRAILEVFDIGDLGELMLEYLDSAIIGTSFALGPDRAPCDVKDLNDLGLEVERADRFVEVDGKVTWSIGGDKEVRVSSLLESEDCMVAMRVVRGPEVVR